MSKRRRQTFKKSPLNFSKLVKPFTPYRWYFAGLTFSVLLIFLTYKIAVQSNVHPVAPKIYFLVEEPFTINDLADTLENRGVINSSLTLRLMAELRGWDQVRKGLFELHKGWNNWQLVTHFKDDSIAPHVMAKVKPYKLRKNVVGKLCDYFPHVNKRQIWQLLRNKEFLDSLGFTRENVFSIFIPGAYPFPKDIQARELLEGMDGHFRVFWNRKRQHRADKLRLTPEEVTILASIVYSETKEKSEMPKIAGVYVNRLENNMRLQSDPTVVYAAKKFGARRVYFADRKIRSPYNTYLHKGLPPGPVHITPAFVIDSVLKCEDHDYLYFCAKDDLSGAHLFAESFNEHRANAESYRKALDKAGVY